MADKAILCVDDEGIIVLSLKQELKSYFGDQFQYETALNAESALELVEDLEVDGVKLILIISDWLMPGLKGDELIQKIAENYPRTQAILITGHADEEALERIRRIPSVLKILKKPWNSQELREIITQAVLPSANQ